MNFIQYFGVALFHTIRFTIISGFCDEISIHERNIPVKTGTADSKSSIEHAIIQQCSRKKRDRCAHTATQNTINLNSSACFYGKSARLCEMLLLSFFASNEQRNGTAIVIGFSQNIS